MISKNYRTEEIPRNLIRKLQEQQKSGDLCDYELKTDCGVNFKVHKWVLSSISPFFVALFTNNGFSKSDSNSLLVPNVTASTLEKVIEFMYTGVVELNSDTCKEVINMALLLNLDTLIDYCIELLIETLNEENCLELLKFSETCVHYGKKLTEESLKLACKKFNVFVESPDFLELSPITMKILVNQNRMAYTEDNLYLAVIKWIGFDKEMRNVFIDELFDKIDFNGLSTEFAKSVLKILSHKNTSINYLGDIETTLRALNAGEKNLYVFADKILMSYDRPNNKFSKEITKMEDDRVGFGYTTFGKDKVFIFGGEVDGGSVETCKYFSMQNRYWVDLPSMKTARYSPSSIAVDDKIYVCGGYSSNDSFISTVELFDINTSVWYQDQDCNLEEFIIYNDDSDDFSNICHLNKCIYFVHSNCVQRLDPNVKQWEIICDEEMNIYVKSVEAYDNYIYAFHEDSISIFDIRTNQWMEHEVAYEKYYNYLPRTCVMDNHIYILGETKENNKYNNCLQLFLLSDLSFVDSHILDQKFSVESFFSI